jgi:hypothetical protein
VLILIGRIHQSFKPGIFLSAREKENKTQNDDKKEPGHKMHLSNIINSKYNASSSGNFESDGSGRLFLNANADIPRQAPDRIMQGFKSQRNLFSRLVCASAKQTIKTTNFFKIN